MSAADVPRGATRCDGCGENRVGSGKDFQNSAAWRGAAAPGWMRPHLEVRPSTAAGDTGTQETQGDRRHRRHRSVRGVFTVAPGGSAAARPGPVRLVVPPGAADSVVDVGGPLTSLRRFQRSKSQASGAGGVSANGRPFKSQLSHKIGSFSRRFTAKSQPNSGRTSPRCGRARRCPRTKCTRLMPHPSHSSHLPVAAIEVPPYPPYPPYPSHLAESCRTQSHPRKSCRTSMGEVRPHPSHGAILTSGDCPASGVPPADFGNPAAPRRSAAIPWHPICGSPGQVRSYSGSPRPRPTVGMERGWGGDGEGMERARARASERASEGDHGPRSMQHGAWSMQRAEWEPR